MRAFKNKFLDTRAGGALLEFSQEFGAAVLGFMVFPRNHDLVSYIQIRHNTAPHP